MPTYSGYDGIELTYPDPADWADAENVVAKDGRTFNMTPAQFAALAQEGMAADGHEHVIADVTDLQAALDLKRNTADAIPVVSDDSGNVITTGADGLAYLSGSLLLPEGPDLSGYATEVYVDNAVAAVGTSFATTAALAEAVQASEITAAATYATIATVDALEATVEAQLAAIADALEAI